MRNLLFIILLLPLLASAHINLDSLWSVWNDSSQTDTNRLKAIQKIAWDGYLFTQPDSAFYFAQIQYDLAEQKNEKTHMASALNIQGVSFHIQGDYTKAINYYTKSLKINEELGNKKGYAATINNVGNIYKNQGDYAKAISCFNKSLKIDEELDNKKGYAATINNIGIIYYNQGDYEKSIEYYSKSLKIKEKLDDKLGMAVSLSNIGNNYSIQGDNVKAMEYYIKSLNIEEEIGDNVGMASSLTNIGVIYFDQGDFAKAMSYYTKGLKIREKVGNKLGVAISLNKIGKVYYKQGNYIKAKNYSLRALNTMQEIGAALEIQSASEALWKAYNKLGNYKESLAMHQLYIATRDSINSEENQKDVIRQEFKYNYDKKEAVAIAEHEAAMQQQETEALAEQKQQNIIIGTVSGGFILIALFLIFVFNRLRVTRRQKNEIGKQKEEIEGAHKETERQKHIIEEAHTEITDSIVYAKRLQDAILPSFDEVSKYLPNNFILFKPKDVVSGDFYWFEQLNGTSYLAAADCTGHGVPGAMVSVVCSNALNRSVKEFGITEPSKILDKTRELVIETFAKSGEDVKDGMDIAICAFKDNKVIYSGANNPLWIVRKTDLITEDQKQERSTIINNGISLIEHKSNKQPIGLYAGMKGFTQEVIDLHPGDNLYFFTDGFADQFGGKKGKKFKYKPFKRFLIDLHTKSMAEQTQLISDAFENWKGEMEQVDDVCIIGVSV